MAMSWKNRLTPPRSPLVPITVHSYAYACRYRHSTNTCPNLGSYAKARQIVLEVSRQYQQTGRQSTPVILLLKVRPKQRQS